MSLFLGFLTLTGAIVWLIILALVLRPALYAMVATASVLRCWRATFRRNAMAVSWWDTLRGAPSLFVDFYGNPTPGNITLSGSCWHWRNIGDWQVWVKAPEREATPDAAADETDDKADVSAP